MSSIPRCASAILAIVAVLVIGATAIAQDKSVLQGKWGEMREESPAKPLADNADAVVRLRQFHMRATSASFRSLEVLINDGRGTSELAIAKATALGALADGNAGIFAAPIPPAGELGAKPQIWSEPDLFREHVAAFAAATKSLEQYVREKDAAQLAPALVAVRYECLACHYYYAAFKDRPGKSGRQNP